MTKKEKKEKADNSKLSLRERLLKNTITEHAAMLEDSKIYGKRWHAPIEIPAMDIALSGKFDGGLQPGITIIAGLSKHFKTGFTLELAKAFQRKFPEGMVLFFDSEFGSPPDYFTARGVDMNRVIHVPVLDLEELQFEMTAQLDELQRGDEVFIMVDSLGNLASKKEKEDMIAGKGTTDMTRAKAYKSFFRVITPMLNMKNIPMIGIAHTYKTMEMFAKDVVSGGTGMMLSADNVWIIGRETVKDDKTIEGYDFKINIEKSRFVKEKSQFVIEVRWDNGINKYSNVVKWAIEAGIVKRPTAQKYTVGDGLDTWSLDQLEHDTKTLEKILAMPEFRKFVEDKYKIPAGQHFVIHEGEEDEDNERAAA